MKKMMMWLLLAALTLGLCGVAAASPTGATQEEIAVYQTQGYAGLGLPQHAQRTLGGDAGAKFVAGKAAQGQGGATAAELVQMLVASGMSTKDAVSFVIAGLQQVGDDVEYTCVIDYVVDSQSVAWLYAYTHNVGTPVGQVSGSGAEFWILTYTNRMNYGGMPEVQFRLEKGDPGVNTPIGNSDPLAVAGPQVLEKPSAVN